MTKFFTVLQLRRRYIIVEIEQYSLLIFHANLQTNNRRFNFFHEQLKFFSRRFTWVNSSNIVIYNYFINDFSIVNAMNSIVIDFSNNYRKNVDVIEIFENVSVKINHEFDWRAYFDISLWSGRIFFDRIQSDLLNRECRRLVWNIDWFVIFEIHYNKYILIDSWAYNS